MMKNILKLLTVAALPLCLGAAVPALYMPLDGSPDVIGPEGGKIAAGIVNGRIMYLPGVVGKSSDVRRHAYDQVGSIEFNTLPAFDCNNGTVSFWFKPHWKEIDPEYHPIIRCDTWKGFRFYLIKGKTGTIELSVCAPGQIQFLRKNLFRQNVWAHVAFTWDTTKGEARLFINGKEIERRKNKNHFKHFEKHHNLRLSLGDSGYDRFKTMVGDGEYDELKVFQDALTPDEIFLLASGGAKEKLENVPLSSVSEKNGSVDFIFRAGESRFGGPKNLAEFDFGNQNTVSLIAMGSSGRISLSATDGKKPKTVQSACILNLKDPHKISLNMKNGKVAFLIDDTLQGELPFTSNLKLHAIRVADKVMFPALSSFPSATEKKNLSDTKTTPLENSFWSLDDAEKRSSGVRSGVTLNGYWRVSPTMDYTYAPDGDWGYIRVPGSYRSPLWQIYMEKNNKLVSQNSMWKKSSLLAYESAWYQRMFEVPAKWLKNGGRIYLNFENLNADFGKVMVNGFRLDSFRQDFKTFTSIPNQRRIDVTDYLSKSGKNVLSVYLDRVCVSFWQGKPSLGDHGEIMIGDVWLENAPSKLSIRNAIAMPSFRQKSVLFRARILNPAKLKGKYTVQYDFLRDSKKEKSFSETFALSGAPEQVVLFSEKWSNPVLWSADDPQTYKMVVSIASGNKTLDTLPERLFGFRELWVENGDFRMNGKPMRMRIWSCPALERMRFYYADPRAIASHVAHIKEMNYDTVRFDPIFRKSSQIGYPGYLNECDRQGVYNLFPMPFYEDDELVSYSDFVERYLENYGGHPSVLMWYSDFNASGYSWAHEPSKLTDTAYDPVNARQARARAKVAEKVMSALDPHRELFQHAGGNAGKVFTSMNYQSFGVPLQEQEDWPAQWSKKHTQPLISVECAFPYPMQFWHFDNAQKYGALTAEHAARYFGDSVFADEKRPVPYNAESWFSNPYANRNGNYFRLSAMLYRHVVKSWRTYNLSGLGDFPGGRDIHQAFRTFNDHNVVYGLENNVKSAGLKPDIPTGWSETQTHLLTDYTYPEGVYDVMRESFEPLLVYLGGMPEDFTNKDHAFFAKEPFRKSVVVVNDYSTPRTLELRWELVADGKVCARDSVRRTAGPGEILKVPIELTSPDVLERTDAELHLFVVKDGVLFKKDVFKLQFFPKRVRPAFGLAVTGLYDPEGRTEAMLKKAGFPFRRVETLSDLKKCRLLIIGQNALDNGVPEFLRLAEKEGMIENGLKILIFEQKQCNLGNLVFESPSYRNAFPRRKDSLYLAGLKTEDFSNWRGSSDTVPAFKVSAEFTSHYPQSKWKCGNGGIVSGNVIRKPSFGNYTSIVDCGFNLMFASLLELRRGHGIVLFCQLDVTSRYLNDPAATKLADNLLFEMSKLHNPIGPVRAMYLGGDKGAELLDRMGVQYHRVSMERLWVLRFAQVVFLGGGLKFDAKNGSALRKILRGRNVVAMPGSPLEYLPVEMAFGKETFFRAVPPKNDPLFAGVTNADLYFREARTLPVVSKRPLWSVATTPALFAKYDTATTSIVVMSVAPDDVEGLWNAEKIARVWTAILTNMNVGLGRDMTLFNSGKTRHNTQFSSFGKIIPEKAFLKLDPKNTGKVSDGPAGFVPVKLGVTWEIQGYRTVNPNYKHPANSPKALLNSPYDGYAWYRIVVRIPESWKGKLVRLSGGPIDDCDWSFINGQPIGETTFTNHKEPYKAIRNYRIPENVLKFGADNVIMIRVFDRWGGGGVTGPLALIADDPKILDSWSPYVDKLDFYDVDAFHNW